MRRSCKLHKKNSWNKLSLDQRSRVHLCTSLFLFDYFISNVIHISTSYSIFLAKNSLKNAEDIWKKFCFFVMFIKMQKKLLETKFMTCFKNKQSFSEIKFYGSFLLAFLVPFNPSIISQKSFFLATFWEKSKILFKYINFVRTNRQLCFILNRRKISPRLLTIDTHLQRVRSFVSVE